MSTLRRDGAAVSLAPVPELSVLDLTASTWLDVLHELGARAVAAGHATPTFPDALVERERHAPTGLPTAVPVAIPHVDPPSVLRSGIGLARLAEPVPWGEMGAPGRQVDVVAVLVLLVGESHAHVDLLSRLMQVLQGDDWYTELRAAADVGSACRAFASRLHVS